jgi:uncharacterized SAM-binding protein YcdF (DUF218 family)
MHRRTLLFAALAVPAAVVAAWIAILVAVVMAAHRDQAARLAEPAAAIIVLGAAQYDGRPSPVLRARLDHGIALWRAGRAPRLIVTGGGRAGDRTTEAAVGRRYAVRHGVPDSVILLESEGRTTSESLRAASAILHELARQDSLRAHGDGAVEGSVASDAAGSAAGSAASGAAGGGASGAAHGDPGGRAAPSPHADAPAPTVPPLAASAPGDADTRPYTAILVSDPFHMLRLGILARRYGIVPITSPTPTSPISARPQVAWQYMLLESVKVPFVYFMEKADE